MAETNNIQPRYIDPPQASTYLSIPVSSIYKMTSAKAIPHIKKGGKILFDTLELDTWMNNDRVKTIDEIKDGATAGNKAA